MVNACVYPGQPCDHRFRKTNRFGRPFYRYPVACRFFRRIHVTPTGCWHWTARISTGGYGHISIDAYPRYAHRVAYELLVGPIPEGLELDHVCHSRDEACAGGLQCLHRRCVNPEHLEPVSTQENTRRGVLARRTHCPWGHAYDDTNTVYENGRRKCRTCLHQRSAARAAKAKAERHRRKAEAERR